VIADEKGERAVEPSMSESEARDSVAEPAEPTTDAPEPQGEAGIGAAGGLVAGAAAGAVLGGPVGAVIGGGLGAAAGAQGGQAVGESRDEENEAEEAEEAEEAVKKDGDTAPD
jgi:uncharacterized protein YcfJ